MSTAEQWRELAIRYLEAAKNAEVKYREYKQLSADYKQAYADQMGATGGVDLVNAAHRASSDPRRQDAGKDAVFFRDEANMYANLAQVAFSAAASVTVRYRVV